MWHVPKEGEHRNGFNSISLNGQLRDSYVTLVNTLLYIGECKLTNCFISSWQQYETLLVVGA